MTDVYAFLLEAALPLKELSHSTWVVLHGRTSVLTQTKKIQRETRETPLPVERQYECCKLKQWVNCLCGAHAWLIKIYGTAYNKIKIYIYIQYI